MLIILLDEPGLFVFPTRADAERSIEAIDVESQVRAAFDEHAVPYRVDWVSPNRRHKGFFGLFCSVTNGEYHFVPAGQPDTVALVRLLEAHPKFAQPPEAQAELSSLLSRLQAGTS
jgi:hypothetical protein